MNELRSLDEMSAVFDKSLRDVARPALEKHGFEFDGRRQFSRRLNGHKVSIEFQLGQRFMAGKFTVNLIIGGAAERLGLVRETLLSRVVDRLFGDFDPWWKGVFLPKERWWSVRTSETRMNKDVAAAVTCIEKYGLPWLKRKAGM